MRAFLVFLSSLLLLCLPAAATQRDDAAESGVARSRHTFSITTPKAYISGIMITAESYGRINGSMVNEFGISAIDFTYDIRKERVKLVRVIGFLDKWYIRRMLANDIKYCLQVLREIPPEPKRGYTVAATSHAVTITNTKRKISYTFSPLPIEQENDTERPAI